MNSATNAAILTDTLDTTMFDRQAPLAELYRQDPKQAWITDSASTSCNRVDVNDPLHGLLSVANQEVPVAVHPAVGGDGGDPVPGDILCAALASCLDSTIRVIANRLSIKLAHLDVHVSGDVDVRGTLQLNREVPVGFQQFHISVNLQAVEGTNATLLDALTKAAEASCVVLQTLRTPPRISTQFNLNEA